MKYTLLNYDNPPPSYYEPQDTDDDSQAVVFYTHHIIKSTRKPHICDNCGAVIPLGTRTNYYSQLLVNSTFEHGWTHLTYNGECVK